MPVLQMFITSESHGLIIFSRILQVKLGDKTYKFGRRYKSPSQTKDEFENFIKNLELNLEHIVNKCPFLIVVLGDLNVRMQGWHLNDIQLSKGLKLILQLLYSV